MQDTIQITFPDQSVQSFPSGITSLAIAQHMSERLASQVVAAVVNGALWDLTRSITTDARLVLYTWEEAVGKQVFWHSSAHLLAEALEVLYPGIQLGIGPAIEQGFYYDVDFGDQPFDATHLATLEAKMRALAAQKNAFKRTEVGKKEAISFFQKKNNSYKLAILENLPDGTITFYQQGNFIDLCKGPHLPHTGCIKAVKLLNIAGAYWRGDTKNKQLTRIYGITFPHPDALEHYLTLQQEAQKRNHQKLGSVLQLFTFSAKVGTGLPLWLPRGAVLRQELTNFLHQIQIKAGYQAVVTPHIGHKALYMTSGHYEKYSQDAFQPMRTPQVGEEFMLKPMNCPHHCEIYNSAPRSYKELPLRLAEFGTVYRYEQHGALHGLTRTRCFTQDDAHIFCRADQVQEEVKKVIDLVQSVFATLAFTDYTAQLSLRDPAKSTQYIGNEADWDKAEQALQAVVASQGLPTVLGVGEAAFYGPKLDFMVKDALGRSWQLGTVQLDYQLPERFNLVYTGADNQKYRPVMLHRAPFGSLERFIAILLEHTAGKLPIWLAPEQVAVLPLSEKYNAYAQSVYQTLVAQKIRSYIDVRDEKIGKKIREAELLKIPYMLIVGEKEMACQAVAIRKQGQGDQGSKRLEAFIDIFNEALIASYRKE